MIKTVAIFAGKTLLAIGAITVMVVAFVCLDACIDGYYLDNFGFKYDAGTVVMTRFGPSRPLAPRSFPTEARP